MSEQHIPLLGRKIRVQWYRSPIDRKVMHQLMRKSDARGFAQVLPQLGLYALTATLAYLAFVHLHRSNWPWALPLLLIAVLAHGTFAHFLGGVGCHELAHKTPFETAGWNELFLGIYAFLSWYNPVAYRASHVRHHQSTAHEDDDGEVVLPQGLDWAGVRFVLEQIFGNPAATVRLLRHHWSAALGRIQHDGAFRADWLRRVVPEGNDAMRREHRNWARCLVVGHIALAILFVATHHWFLIVIITFGARYGGWLAFLCGGPQHAGLTPNVADFRLCTRTYTCGPFIGFLYWNMQYHLEHHMFPAVPFYQLPRLRQAIASDLPPAPHGLWATWRELWPILRRQRREPGYAHRPALPQPGPV